MSTNKELIAEYLRDLKIYERSEPYIENAGYTLDRFDIIVQKPFSEVKPEDIKRYVLSIKEGEAKAKLGEKKVVEKRTTTLSYLNILAKFFEHLIDERGFTYNPHNPVKRVRREIAASKIGKAKIEIPTLDQISKMVKLIFNPEHRALIVLFFKSGARLNEVRMINAGDLDFEKRRIKVLGKNRIERYLYFDEEAKRALEDWLRTRDRMTPKDDALFISSHRSRLSEAQIQRIVKQAAGIAKAKYGDPIYDQMHVHLFRHIFTSVMAKAHCHVRVLQELRGDEEKSMVDYYSHFSDEEIQEEYERCIPKLGI